MAILADGQVAITQSTIFEADGSPIFDSASFTIEKITFFNTNAEAQTAILYLQKRNVTSIEIRQFILQQNEGGEYLEPGEVLTLENGDELLAETTTASAVNFAVVGERT